MASSSKLSAIDDQAVRFCSIGRDVCFWHKADIGVHSQRVSFSTQSGHVATVQMEGEGFAAAFANSPLPKHLERRDIVASELVPLPALMNSVAHIVLIRVDFMLKEIWVRKNIQDWIEARRYLTGVPVW